MSKLFRRFLATSAAVAMLATASIPAHASAERFTDVKPGAWYYTAVDYAVGEGLFSGTSSSTFAPDEPMTRGMFVTVLGNKANIEPGEYPDSSFSDVAPGKWYAPFVEWAAGKGIVNGVGDGKFAPNRNVTREQMAVILYNYAKFAGADLTVQAGLLERFPDGGTVSKYARYAMEWALTHEIMGGSDGKLDPLGTATRAQVAQIFYNSRELFDDGGDAPKPPEPSPSPDPDAPKIDITDEVRAKLKPNQDPEKILDYVLHGKHDDPTFAYDGTTAKWDPALTGRPNTGKLYLGPWLSDESEMNGSSVVANGFIQILEHTDSDRFYITAKDEDGSFCLYYHPADKPESGKMRAVRAALNLPGSKVHDRGLCYTGSGWAGPMVWEQYGGARGIADKIEFYLTEMHPYATKYYLTEPSPGIFYLLY